MDWSATAHWSLVQLLSQYASTHNLKVVGLSSFCEFFVLSMALPQWVSCPAVLAIIHSFLFLLGFTVMFLEGYVLESQILCPCYVV